MVAPGWPEPAGFDMIAYRDAVPADAAALDASFDESFSETFGASLPRRGPRAFLSGFAHRRIGREQLADPGFAFRLAEADGAPVGYVKLGPLKLPVEPAGPALPSFDQLYVLQGMAWRRRSPRR